MPFLYSDAQDMWDVLNGDEGLQFITAIDESNLGIKHYHGMMQEPEVFIP